MTWLFSIVSLGALFPFLMSEQKENSLIILNMPNHQTLPKKFRSAKDVLLLNVSPQLNLEGLDLNISGSGQFSEESLNFFLQYLEHPNNCYIIDLRQECHGFVNGLAVSWYTPRNWHNISKTSEQIQEEESMLLNKIPKEEHLAIFKIIKKHEQEGNFPDTTSLLVLVEEILTERQLTERNQLNYIRLPVTDHQKPNMETIDQFIAFIQSLPTEHWLHFHCAGGAGRSTTFMSIYDMMKNAKNVKFEDILYRQYALGGSHLADVKAKDDWKHIHAQERLEFLKMFYEYCKNNSDGFQQTWSDYLIQNRKGDDDFENL